MKPLNKIELGAKSVLAITSILWKHRASQQFFKMLQNTAKNAKIGCKWSKYISKLNEITKQDLVRCQKCSWQVPAYCGKIGHHSVFSENCKMLQKMQKYVIIGQKKWNTIEIPMKSLSKIERGVKSVSSKYQHTMEKLGITVL